MLFAFILQDVSLPKFSNLHVTPKTESFPYSSGI